MDPYHEVVKFGKKVDYGKMISSEELMEEHLRQIKEKLATAKSTQHFKRA